MHELGIVFHVIRAVENIGREQGLTDVASVTLELGQVSSLPQKGHTRPWGTVS